MLLLIDIIKTFDIVWHESLLTKLSASHLLDQKFLVNPRSTFTEQTYDQRLPTTDLSLSHIQHLRQSWENCGPRGFLNDTPNFTNYLQFLALFPYFPARAEVVFCGGGGR